MPGSGGGWRNFSCRDSLTLADMNPNKLLHIDVKHAAQADLHLAGHNVLSNYERVLRKRNKGCGTKITWTGRRTSSCAKTPPARPRSGCT